MPECPHCGARLDVSLRTAEEQPPKIQREQRTRAMLGDLAEVTARIVLATLQRRRGELSPAVLTHRGEIDELESSIGMLRDHLEART